jgi:hypothetical protein
MNWKYFWRNFDLLILHLALIIFGLIAISVSTQEILQWLR